MKRINLLKILKAKIPYFLTGLLVLAIVCAALFSPEVYFRIEDWAAEANPQTEDATLQGRENDFITSEKLQMLGSLDIPSLDNYSDTTFNTPLGNIRLSKSFIASGSEIPRKDLSVTIKDQLQTICTYFDPSTYTYTLLSELSEDVMTRLPSGKMYEIVSLASTSQGFVVWDVNYTFDNGTCSLLMDAVNGRIYYLTVNQNKNGYYAWQYDTWQETNPIEENNDLLVRNFYQFATSYWGLPISPENTRYSTNKLLGCDSLETGCSAEMEYQYDFYSNLFKFLVTSKNEES